MSAIACIAWVMLGVRINCLKVLAKGSGHTWFLQCVKNIFWITNKERASRVALNLSANVYRFFDWWVVLSTKWVISYQGILLIILIPSEWSVWTGLMLDDLFALVTQINVTTFSIFLRVTEKAWQHPHLKGLFDWFPHSLLMFTEAWSHRLLSCVFTLQQALT